jgi:hypothetical protein
MTAGFTGFTGFGVATPYATLKNVVPRATGCTKPCKAFKPCVGNRHLHRLSHAIRSLSASSAACHSHAHPSAKTKHAPFQNGNWFIPRTVAIPPRRVTDSPGRLTNWAFADKFLTLARANLMADPLHGKGPVFRTLREIAALPEGERFEAFVDRLDLLDADECAKVVKNRDGEVMYAATSNKVRLSILEVGKQWLVDAQAQGKPTGKLAGLAVFNGGANKKAS